MPISFYRYQQGNICISTYVEQLAAHDFCNHLQSTLETLDGSEIRLHFIGDWRRADNCPISYDMLSLISQLLRHRNMGSIVVLGMSPALQFWCNMFGTILGLKYHTTNSLDEAIKQIRAEERITDSVQTIS
jgi:hypothetical protein